MDIDKMDTKPNIPAKKRKREEAAPDLDLFDEETNASFAELKKEEQKAEPPKKKAKTAPKPKQQKSAAKKKAAFKDIRSFFGKPN